jgi:hypothetical protein
MQDSGAMFDEMDSQVPFDTGLLTAAAGLVAAATITMSGGTADAGSNTCAATAAIADGMKAPGSFIVSGFEAALPFVAGRLGGL